MAMDVGTKVDNLLKDPNLNDPKNDVRWASGWTRQIHTAQWRFGRAEAQKLSASIQKLSKTNQRKVVAELLQRATPGKAIHGGPSFPADVTFISAGAAGIMNTLAKKLGLEGKFPVDTRRQPTPMG